MATVSLPLSPSFFKEESQVSTYSNRGPLSNFAQGAYQYVRGGGLLTSLLVSELINTYNGSESQACQAYQTRKKFALVNPFTDICVIGPIIVEIIFRDALQSGILHSIPKTIAKKVSPGSEKIFDTTTAKALRIGLSSIAFGLAHCVNTGVYDPKYVFKQIIGGMLMGIFLGRIKESKLGLSGAIGAHFMNNFVAIAWSAFVC